MDQFVETHAALILRLSRRVSRPPLNPEDVAQEVVTSLLHWHREGRFDPAGVKNAEAYLRVVASHVAARLARKQRLERLDGEQSAGESGAEKASSIGEAPPPVAEEYAEQRLLAREQLEQLKGRLRPRDALVLALLVEDGLSLQQVAETLGLSMNNLHQISHRIRLEARELFDALTSQV